MSKNLVFLILFALFISSCSQKEESVKLAAGTPAYKLAKDLTNKLSFLDPDKNNIFVSTTLFDVTSGEVIQYIHLNYGKRSENLIRMDAAGLKIIVEKNAKKIAETKLWLNAAKNAQITVAQAEIDSVLNFRFSRVGGEKKYLELLKERGLKLDVLKQKIRDELIIQHYKDEVLGKETEVTEADIRKAYQEDKTATVRHILLSTQGKSDSEKQEIRKKMEDILDRARNGEDFSELAKEYTDDTGSKNTGGLYKDFTRGRMVKPFEEAAFSVPVGEISDIVETKFGFHIIKVLERKKDPRPYEKFKTEFGAQLKQKKQKDVYQAHLNKMKDDVNFKVLKY